MIAMKREGVAIQFIAREIIHLHKARFIRMSCLQGRKFAPNPVMPECSNTAKASFISYTVVAVSIGFIPIAILSSVTVIICMIKHPYEGLKAPLNALIVSSSVASLVSVPVNCIRAWYHSWNATGTNPHKHFPSTMPMIDSCHVFWYCSQFVVAFLSLIALISVTWKNNPFLNSILHQRATIIGSLVAIAWMSSIGLGLASIWTGMSKMQSAQPAINLCIILADLYICCGISLSSKERHTEQLNDNDENSGMQNGSQNPIHVEPCRIIIPDGSIQAEDEQPTNLETIADTEAEDLNDEIQYACHQAMAFALCSTLSGAMLLVYMYVDSISCSAMYWIDEIGKLSLQALLAINPAIIIVHNEKVKNAVTRMLRLRNTIQPENP